MSLCVFILVFRLCGNIAVILCNFRLGALVYIWFLHP